MSSRGSFINDVILEWPQEPFDNKDSSKSVYIILPSTFISYLRRDWKTVWKWWFAKKILILKIDSIRKNVHVTASHSASSENRLRPDFAREKSRKNCFSESAALILRGHHIIYSCCGDVGSFQRIVDVATKYWQILSKPEKKIQLLWASCSSWRHSGFKKGVK